MLQFCKWNLCPFLLCTRLELLNSPWSLLSDSPLHDAPYIFNRRQIWTAGRPVKHTHSMCMKPLCFNPCCNENKNIISSSIDVVYSIDSEIVQESSVTARQTKYYLESYIKQKNKISSSIYVEQNDNFFIKRDGEIKQ